jgi:hypothetical protein
MTVTNGCVAFVRDGLYKGEGQQGEEETFWQEMHFPASESIAIKSQRKRVYGNVNQNISSAVSGQFFFKKHTEISIFGNHLKPHCIGSFQSETGMPRHRRNVERSQSYVSPQFFRYATTFRKVLGVLIGFALQVSSVRNEPQTCLPGQMRGIRKTIMQSLCNVAPC